MARASFNNGVKVNGSVANGSVTNHRVVAAGMRAIEAHARVRRIAEHLTKELTEVTPPHGIPVAELDTGDSMVIAVENVISTARTVTKRGL